MAKSIEITTTQNVTIEYELALLRERALAWMLDLFIVMMFWYFLQVISILQLLFAQSEAVQQMFTALSPFILFFTYNILFEILKNGQTPGKMAMGIKVVRLDGRDPEWGDVLLRTLLQLIDSFFSAAIIGAILIKTTDASQRLGDIAAHTTVIKIQGRRFHFRLHDILRISSLENYQPVFPQVKKLSEDDMIFIKTVLSRVQKYPNRAHQDALEDLVTHLMPILEIDRRPLNRQEFLKTLLRDYIVLTR
ncbi:MAG: RDD family protein [Lewinellaceae bacterium]|nr:RDD family protein [Lewinellaceae bacterium]